MDEHELPPWVGERYRDTLADLFRIDDETGND